MASPNREGVMTFLERAGVSVLWDTPPSVWERSGSAFGAYAEHHKLSVITFDDTAYKAVFPGLSVLGAD